MELRRHGDATLPALIYLPGLHGDWTLISSFRQAVEGRVHFVELAYPRAVTPSLADLARAILTGLQAQGITTGWLLAESFGSQVAWAMLQEIQSPGLHGAVQFTPAGLILAGGFVRHPVIPGVRLAKVFCAETPPWFLRLFLWVYPKYARFRHRRAPETLRDIAEFVVRRQTPGDREAMAHRLNLIAAADFRALARTTRVPVYSLTGFWDPIVFWWPVRAWLRHECPALRGDRLLFWADHTVLATQPDASAQQVLAWMGPH